MEPRRQILVFGASAMLEALAAALRVSPLLEVVEGRTRDELAALGPLHPAVIVVDAAEAMPEQFRELMAACRQRPPPIISLDPETYQLTVLSALHPDHPLAEAARVIGILSFALPPAGSGRGSSGGETP